MLARIKHPHLILLSAILIFNAYLRLWGITHLFFWLSDYDEGAYSLGGRLISQGYLPYKDFTLVHPPFYDLVLGAIYKVFGYNFFYGRYFSVLLSFTCIILVYLIIKKLYHPTAGLVAAFLFTIFPGFYYAWYRAVQEPLGIFLILLALFFASNYIKSREHGNRLLFSGLCFGLAIATKYTFAAAAIAFVIGIVVISAEWNRRDIHSYYRRFLKREIWLLSAGTIAGFFLVAGFFILKAPQAYFAQTFASQLGYRFGNTGAYILSRLRALPLGIIQIFHLVRGSFEQTIAMVCVIVGIVLLIALFCKRNRAKPDVFLLIMALICFALSSLFNPFGELRYFVSFYCYILLAIVTFIPAINKNTVTEQITIHALLAKTGSIVIGLVLIIFTIGTVAFRMNYNFLDSNRWTYEEQSYKDTINYLESVGAKKVYTMDPIFIALAPNLNPAPLTFDMFGELMIINASPAELCNRLLNEGVDYVVQDPSALWSINPQNKSIGEFCIAIHQNGVLVQTFDYNGVNVLGTQIYKVTSP